MEQCSNSLTWTSGRSVSSGTSSSLPPAQPLSLPLWPVAAPSRPPALSPVRPAAGKAAPAAEAPPLSPPWALQPSSWGSSSLWRAAPSRPTTSWVHRLHVTRVALYVTSELSGNTGSSQNVSGVFSGMGSIGQLYHWQGGNDLSLLKEERKFVIFFLIITLSARVVEYPLLTLPLDTCVFERQPRGVRGGGMSSVLLSVHLNARKATIIPAILLTSCVQSAREREREGGREGGRECEN